MKLPDPVVMYADMAKGLAGYLECATCRWRLPLTEQDSARYLSRGWPECCGQTMHAHTRSSRPGAGKERDR